MILRSAKSFIFISAFCLLLALPGCKREEAALSPSPSPLPIELAVPTERPALYIEIAPTPWTAPTPSPDALNAGEGVYTIAWFSDTQHYSKSYPASFYAMTRFLAQQRQRIGIGYIVFTGDFVQDYNAREQWAVAQGAMAQIAGIPQGVLAGNHDVDHGEADYSYFCEYFGEARYKDSPWYGGSYGDNRGHYDLITLGSTDYIFAYMGYAPDSGAYTWLREAFNSYPDRVGILCVHDYFTTAGLLSSAGERFYREVVARCPNLYMVLCGHRYNQLCLPAYFDDDGDGESDRCAYQLMGNYQAAGKEGGSGYMRFLQVDEALGEIRVYSYSPLLQDFNHFDTLESQLEKYPADPAGEEFVIPLPWTA